jgi:hypothetical protein
MLPKDWPCNDLRLLGFCNVCDSFGKYGIAVVCTAVLSKKSYESLDTSQSGQAKWGLKYSRSIQRKTPLLKRKMKANFEVYNHNNYLNAAFTYHSM